MEHYQLDGWVTEHANLLMDISNLYRCLAGFEADPHRSCVMHRARAKPLEPLSTSLNPQYFLGLQRSVNLELGNIYRTIMELKEAEGRPAGKVSGAGRDALLYYQRFIDTFRDAGPGRELPARVDEDSERFFLLASFSMGRVLHKSRPPPGGTSSGTQEDGALAGMQAAYTHLRWTAEYVKKWGVKEFEREAELAGELAELVLEKISLTQRVAALSPPKQPWATGERK